MPNFRNQLMLWDHDGSGQLPDQGEQIGVSFLHKSFCVAGLPLRKPKNSKALWKRYDDRFALTVHPHSMVLPGGKEIDVGVPYGPKSRLLAIWLATEVHNPQRHDGDCWIEIGDRPNQWLETIGVRPKTGESGNTNIAKDQLVRLTFSQFTMVLKNQDDQYLFKRDHLIDSSIFEVDQVDLYAKGKIGAMNWPVGVQLTRTAYDRFKHHSIPIPSARLRKVAQSPMAIDIFVYLCYTLPHIQAGETEIIRWRDLIAQFGSNEAPSKFVETFSASIRSALAAYEEANVELTDEGLRMQYSDPAVLRRAFTVVPGDKRIALSKQKNRTIAQKIERERPVRKQS